MSEYSKTELKVLEDAVKAQSFKYKIRLFIERARLRKRSEEYIKEAVKKKFNVELI